LKLFSLENAEKVEKIILYVLTKKMNIIHPQHHPSTDLDRDMCHCHRLTFKAKVRVKMMGKVVQDVYILFYPRKKYRRPRQILYFLVEKARSVVSESQAKSSRTRTTIAFFLREMRR